jgi:hypothetical protein
MLTIKEDFFSSSWKGTVLNTTGIATFKIDNFCITISLDSFKEYEKIHDLMILSFVKGQTEQGKILKNKLKLFENEL